MNLLSSLRYLVALSEHRHFARAAQACHISQPALSHALRALEAEFGTAIVRRGRTYAGLTAEGERILLTARRMLREHELLQEDLRGSAKEPTGNLRLGVVPSAMPIAARFAGVLAKVHPGISVTLRSLSSAEIEAGLQDLAIDLALGFSERLQKSEARRFMHYPQYGERYFVLRATGSGSGLHVGPSIGWSETAKMRLCLLTPEMHNRQVVDRAFAEAGVDVRPSLETNSVAALLQAVTLGSLCSVVPGALAAVAPAGVGLEALPLVRPEIQTPVGFFVLQDVAPSRALAAAVAVAQSDAWLADVAAHTGSLASFKN